MNKLVLTIILFTLSLSNAHATLLSANGTSVNALDLNNDVSSFAEFYDYNGSLPWRSNTGFEIANEIVVFVATLNSEYAVFMTVGGSGSLAGSLQLDVTASDGNITLYDDPNEVLSGNTINWQYNAGGGDGFVFSNFTSNIWNVNLDFLTAANVFGITFLSFDVDGNDSVALNTQDITSDLLIISSSSSSFVPVESPASVAMLGLGLLFIALRRRV
ncbi:MAG: hypothetical protein ACI9YE_001242 [Psychroserpens sp.]|jgi:hypothetical protein